MQGTQYGLNEEEERWKATEAVRKPESTKRRIFLPLIKYAIFFEEGRTELSPALKRID